MAAAKGRELVIKTGTTALAGVRTKTLSIGAEPIDITSDDDAGYRTLLSTAGQMQIDMTVEGITKDAELRAIIVAGGSMMLTNITIEYQDGATLTGDFYLASVEETGAYNEAITFSASLQSSGQWTYTP